MTLDHTFLITGLPRIRSAWLAAILSSDTVQCVHDAAVSVESIEGFVRYHKLMQPVTSETPQIIVGLADPCAACMYPEKAIELFCESPVVIIDRDPIASRQSYEKWLGKPTTSWEIMERAHALFCERIPNAVHINYEALDDYAIVNRICQHCTGQRLNRFRFDAFNLLKIEQHTAKAVSRITHESTN